MDVLNAMLERFGDDAYFLACRLDEKGTEAEVDRLEDEWQNGQIFVPYTKNPTVYDAAEKLHDIITGKANTLWLQSLTRETATELCRFLYSGCGRFNITVAAPMIVYRLANDLATEWNAMHPSEIPIDM